MSNSEHSGTTTEDIKLSDREKLILQTVVYNYILNADPIGSRSLARRYHLGLSPATIRNTMADLEEMGMLCHPHTSAGRLPTDRGYRHYVNDLMQVEELSERERQAIRAGLESHSPEVGNLFQQVSELLAGVSRLLAVITAPDLSGGVLDRVELVRVASGRIMVVVVVSSGLVNTILLEITSGISDEDIAAAARFINSRLAGMRLSDIPVRISERLKGEHTGRNAVIRMFLEFPDRIFHTEPSTEVHVGLTSHVVEQPEYSSPERLKGIIELIEDRDIIVHLLQERHPGVTVTIGDENRGERLRDSSVITSTYRIGDAQGTLGIIGPTRMHYARLFALVDFTAKLVAERIGAGD